VFRRCGRSSGVPGQGTHHGIALDSCGEGLQIGFDWVAQTLSGAYVELDSVQRALDHVPLKPTIEQQHECVDTDVIGAEPLVQPGKLYE